MPLVCRCRLWPRVDCRKGMTYEKLLDNIIDKRLQKWTSRKCLPYKGGPAWSCVPADACASELPKGELIGGLWRLAITAFNYCLIPSFDG